MNIPAPKTLFVRVAFFCFFVTSHAQARTLRFKNRCQEDIWVAGIGSPLELENTGFELLEGHTKSITVSADLRSARFWARTDCQFYSAPEWENTPFPERFVCASGDCGSTSNGYQIECSTSSGQPPVSLIEMTFSSTTHDTYDLSNVDGYSIGYGITPFGKQMKRLDNPSLGQYNCGDPFCKLDVDRCPDELRVISSTNDTYCLSICAAVSNPAQVAKHTVLQEIVDGGLTDLVCCRCGCGTGCGCENAISKYCCSPYNDNLPDQHGGICDLNAMPKVKSGHFAGMTYEDVFKTQCAESYSWQFNDNESTYQCINADYEITFCAHPTGSSGINAGQIFFLILTLICIALFFIFYYLRVKHPETYINITQPIEDKLLNTCCKCLRPSASDKAAPRSPTRRTVALLEPAEEEEESS